MTRQEGMPAVDLAAVDLTQCALLLRPGDDVAVTTRDLAAGTRVLTASGEILLTGDVSCSHKLAVRDVPAGSAVRK